jgi:short-subunit dehydrogenase
MKQIDKHAYGPWALVTGASSGIGEEFARQVAASGINVVLVARREERLREVAAELTARYEVQARVVALDLGRDGILGPVRRATDDLDIGLVVSNAGAGNPGPFISLPHERLREVVQLNVITHLDLAHHFGQRLAERGHGGIVLVSAVAAAGGLPYMANDSATKAYVLNLGEALHVELRQAGVHVTVLVPVLVNTPVVARIGIDKIGLSAEAISPEQAVGEALTALAEGRVSTLERAGMSGAFEDMKGAVVEMIRARLAASQPAH